MTKKTGKLNMSSTNDIDNKIKDIFDGIVTPNIGSHNLNTQLDAAAESYYEQPKSPAHVYYSFIDTSSQESFAKYIESFWNEEGTPQFAAKANELSALAFELSKDHESQSEELSPFVYTMY